MRRRLNFFTHYMYGTLCFRNFLGAFFQNFGAAARAGIRNQGPAGSESRIRPAARPGIKNQGRCAARNRESRITAGGITQRRRKKPSKGPTGRRRRSTRDVIPVHKQKHRHRRATRAQTTKTLLKSQKRYIKMRARHSDSRTRGRTYTNHHR